MCVPQITPITFAVYLKITCWFTSIYQIQAVKMFSSGHFPEEAKTNQEDSKMIHSKEKEKVINIK